MTTATTVNVQFQLRADTAANWTAENPILLANEFALETDTKKLKVGDGTTAWASLAYFPSIVSGGTVLGNLEIGSTGTLTFEGSTANDFETTLAVTDPTADRTITLPDVSGTVVTTGDTGSVTSAMIADGTVVNADINASAAIDHSKLATMTAGYVLIGNASNVPTATQVTGDVTISDSGVTAIGSGVIVDADIAAGAEIAVSKLANGTANQVLVTDGTDVSWSDDLTIAGNLTVNGTTTTVNTETLVLAANNDGATGTTANNTFRFTDLDTNTAADQPIGKIEWYSADTSSPGARAVSYILSAAAGANSGGDIRFGVSANAGSASEAARIDSSGSFLVGTSSDSGGALLQVNGNRIRVATAKTPASASDTGTTGEICWDASYIYVCTATNTWKRAALSTW